MKTKYNVRGIVKALTLIGLLVTVVLLVPRAMAQKKEKGNPDDKTNQMLASKSTSKQTKTVTLHVKILPVYTSIYFISQSIHFAYITKNSSNLYLGLNFNRYPVFIISYPYFQILSTIKYGAWYT